MKKCLNCEKEIKKNRKFCNTQCQNEFQSKTAIEKWKQKEWSGTTKTGEVSDTIRKYMFLKNKNECEICKWGQVNKKTKLIPLQIHHIDGNSLNNFEENLQLLCPNCHSLTSNFGSLNKTTRKKNGRNRKIEICITCKKEFVTYSVQKECKECQKETIKEEKFFFAKIVEKK